MWPALPFFLLFLLVNGLFVSSRDWQAGAPDQMSILVGNVHNPTAGTIVGDIVNLCPDPIFAGPCSASVERSILYVHPFPI